jgi:membrane protein YdbS with pleckstrin-like domain
MIMSSLIKQKSYERIEHVLRRHPITFIPEIALFLVLAAVPVIVYLLINTLFPTLLQGPVIYPISILAGSIYYLSILLFFYAQFITYYLDVWVVTNDRIIDVEQLGLFSRTISEVDLFRIQDVTSDIHGVFATFFNYGNVAIKTASVNVNIVAKNVPHANKIREDLIRLAHEDRKYHFSQPGNKK